MIALPANTPSGMVLVTNPGLWHNVDPKGILRVFDAECHERLIAADGEWRWATDLTDDMGAELGAELVIEAFRIPAIRRYATRVGRT